MSGNSKRERVDAMIRRAVDDHLREVAYYEDELRAALKVHGNLERICDGAAYRISGDPYRMRELQDIMDWKQPRSI